MYLGTDFGTNLNERVLGRIHSQNARLRLLGEADGAVKMDAVNEDAAVG